MAIVSSPLPFDRSYWVIPGRFLAGFYPGDQNAQVARDKLNALLECGVQRVINLMAVDETNDGGDPFFAYEGELVSLAAENQLQVTCQLPLAAVDHELLVETTGVPRVVVANKSDLEAAWCASDLKWDALVMSARTGEGSDQLGPAILQALGSREDLRDTPALANVRHIELLRQTQEALRRAQDAATQALPEELVLADLRAAREALEEITGRRTSEDVLRHILDRFCIGK